MDRLLLLRLLFTPSLPSALCVGGFSVVLLGLINWPFFIQNPVISNYFFGPEGVIAGLKYADSPLTILFHAFSSNTLYVMGVIAIAILVGLIIYIILESFDHSVLGTASVVAAIQESDTRSRTSVEREIASRMTVRVIGIILWTVYVLFYLNIIVPFCVIISRIPFDQITTKDIGYALLGLGTLFVSTHIHIILLRLVALRPRLFAMHEILTANNV